MEPSEYQRVYEMQGSYWWYAGLRELLLSYIGHEQHDLTLLDAGCGTGAILKYLPRVVKAFGVDYSGLCLDFWKKENLQKTARASVLQLPFHDQQFDLVISTDVLYHYGVQDDRKAMTEFHRVLKPGGRLLLHLPAYEFLRGSHDLVIHTQRRYTRLRLESKLRSTGFHPDRITYRNTFLFPALLMRRLVGRKQAKSDLTRIPTALNEFLRMMIRMENKLLKWINFPFGSSLFCVASKM